MALVTTANRKLSAQPRKKAIRKDDSSEDDSLSETCTSLRGSVDIDCEYNYTASSDSSDDDEDIGRDDEIKKTNILTEASPVTKEEQVIRSLRAIDTQQKTLENRARSTSIVLASALSGWDLNNKIHLPKSLLNSNIMNICNNNNATSGVSTLVVSLGNTLRSKPPADRMFRPAGLIEAGADYSISYKDGVDPETYSYVPLNGCYMNQKSLVREIIQMQKAGRTNGPRVPVVSYRNEMEESKTFVNAEKADTDVDIDFNRTRADYLLKPDQPPRAYSYVENQVPVLPGEKSNLKDSFSDFVIIPTVTELAGMNIEVPPLSRSSPHSITQVFDDNPSHKHLRTETTDVKQATDDGGIENAYRQLVRIKMPNSQNEHIPGEDFLELEQKHPTSAGSLAFCSLKASKQLDKVVRFKSAPICPVPNPPLQVSPAFLEDFHTNGKDNSASTGACQNTRNDVGKKVTQVRSVSRQKSPFNCFENPVDNGSNKQPDNFGLPEVVGSPANAVKRPVLKSGRRSAREVHKVSVVKGNTLSGASKLGATKLHSDKTGNQGSPDSRIRTDILQFPSIQNLAVVSGTKLKGAFTISRILQ